MALTNLSIAKKLAFGFITLCLMFLGVSVLVFTSLARVEHAAAAVRTSAAMQGHANKMMTNVIEQQNAVRGYTILGKTDFLDTYRENRAALEKAATAFDRMADTPEQRALLAEFTDAVKTWHETKLEKTIALASNPATRLEAQEMAGVKQLGGMRKPMKDIEEALAERTEADLAAQDRAAMIARISLIGGGTLAVAVAAMLGWLLARAIARPIAGMTAAMGRLAAGDNSIAVSGEARRDEIGSMAQAVIVFRDAAIAKAASDAEQMRMVDQVADGLGRLAASDLTARLDGMPPAYAKLQQDFNSAVSALSAALGSVRESTGEIRTSAREISTASDDLSMRTEQQAASLEETAAAMEEITSTVRQTAAHAGSANAAVGNARVEAEQSGEVVRRAVDAMGGIERASHEISDIISVIDGIAFQTNLLALNAGVEAARAGDAGKGFAVVAAEVRALAQRSADAAKDVKDRITASERQVEAGVALVGQTGEALVRIIRRINEISSLVGSIAQSAEQQATGLQQVNTAVGEMDGATQQNAAMVEQSTAAARGLAAEAEALEEQVGRFRLGEPTPAQGSDETDWSGIRQAVGWR